ncbi:diacylglycerol kinase family protein [Streptococcus iniae]
MKTVAIFYNPKSGKKDDQLQETVKNSLINHGFSAENITIICPENSKDAFEKAKKVAQAKTDIVIPLGGDGTLNKIIGGVYEGGSFSKIGLIPSGTVNNFAKSLSIPLDVETAIKTIVAGNEKRVDICKANDNYMISSLTLGLLADIAANVTSEEKRKWVPLAFLKDSIKILRRNRSYHLSIETPQKTTIIKTRFLLITMSNTIAGFHSFSPDALVNDGLLQVYTMKKIAFFPFLKHINEFRQGDFSNAKQIKHFHTNSLKLSPVRKDHFAVARTRIDGDKSDYLPIDLTVLKEAITVIVP